MYPFRAIYDQKKKRITSPINKHAWHNSIKIAYLFLNINLLPVQKVVKLRLASSHFWVYFIATESHSIKIRS